MLTFLLALRRKHGLYLLALFFEVVAFHRHVLFERGFLFPWDFRGVHLPLASFVAASFRRGEWPLWDPYTYCGNPIFANIQTALFYPPVLLATLASNWFGADSLPRLLVIAVAAQVFFAGICTFALLRRLGAQAGAAFVAATVYQLGCFFAVQAEHMGAMHGGSWLPLVWWCVVELRAGLRWFWLALLALALSMTVFAGLPQVAVAAFGSALVLALVMAASGLAQRWLPARVLLAWLWGLLLAAVQLLPTVELTNNSVAKYRTEWLKTGGGLHPGALLSLVIPNYWNVFDVSKFHGPTDLTFLYLYGSLGGLALALAAVCWKPDRFGAAFGLFTVAATVWMLGDHTVVGRTILMALPVNIRIGIHPEYTLPVFALAIAVLAGWGAHRWLPPRWQIAAGAIIAADLLLVSSGRPFNTTSVQAEPGIAHDSIDGSAALAQRLRALTETNRPPYRFDMADAPYLWSSSTPILEIPTANGCDPMALERIIQLRLSFAPGERWGTCYQVVNAASPVIGLANVGYLVSRSPVQAGQFERVEEIAGYTLYRNSRVQPRFFLVDRVQPVESLAEAARALHAADFDPERTAIVEAVGGLGESATGGSRADQGVRPTVEVISYGNAALRLRVRTSGGGFLVAAESWYPGWEAVLDGKPARLYVADVAFRGVMVPAGEHEITMRFVPRILYWSGGVSLLALAGIGWAVRAGRSVAGRGPASNGGTAAGIGPPGH